MESLQMKTKTKMTRTQNVVASNTIHFRLNVNTLIQIHIHNLCETWWLTPSDARKKQIIETRFSLIWFFKCIHLNLSLVLQRFFILSQTSINFLFFLGQSLCLLCFFSMFCRVDWRVIVDRRFVSLFWAQSKVQHSHFSTPSSQSHRKWQAKKQNSVVSFSFFLFL